MNPITIIISDGCQTHLIVDGKRLNGVSEMSFSHVAAEDVELNIKFGSIKRAHTDASSTLLKEAAKLLGYEVAANC